MTTHLHTFLDSEWPFSEATNTMAFTTTKVVREGHPVLLVTHDSDGDWQVLCGTNNDSAHALIECLGCLFERDRSIGELADLPYGWIARRDAPEQPWHREAQPPDAPEAQVR